MTATGTTRVWDLADESSGRAVRRRAIDVGGPVAAVAGIIALGAATAPWLPTGGRWTAVVAAGGIAVLVGFSALRRRQTVAALLLAVLGLVAPIVAGAMTMDAAMRAPRAVISRVVEESAAVQPDRLVPTSAFAALPADDRADAEAFATALVLRLRTVHGSFGPYPTSLALSSGSVVEGPGPLGGTALGTVPDGMRLVYEVGSRGDSYQVTVVSTTQPGASVAASSALVVPGAD